MKKLIAKAQAKPGTTLKFSMYGALGALTIEIISFCASICFDSPVLAMIGKIALYFIVIVGLFTCSFLGTKVPALIKEYSGIVSELNEEESQKSTL